jgi:hypothetical protein
MERQTLTSKDQILMAYAVMDDIETVAPTVRKLTDDELKAVADAKDVLARQYIELVLSGCKYESGHESEFFGDELQADIIAYHKRADEWPEAGKEE